MDNALLMQDTPGEKRSRIPQMLKRSPAVNVLRGELLEPIPGDEIVTRTDGQKPHNYRVVSDATVTLYCSYQELSPLGQYEFVLLQAVSTPGERYSLFLSNNMLDWGQRLKPGDDVFVLVPGKASYPTQASPRAAAKVRYVGGLGLGGDMKTGLYFGVEIMEERYRGQGTTDGTFKGARYFLCKDDCGLFVSLDKLSPDREGSTLSRPPPGGQSHIHREEPQKPAHDGSNPGRPQAPVPAPRSHLMITRSRDTPVDPPKSKLEKGDRVVIHNKNGIAIHGMVRWAGNHAATQQLDCRILGIETDVPVRPQEVEFAVYGLTHLFAAKDKRCQLFMPEGLVLSVDEHAEKRVKAAPREIPHGKQVGGMELSEEELAASHEAFKEIEEKKMKEDVRQALPDESINVPRQEEELRRYEEDKARRHAQKRESQGPLQGQASPLYSEVAMVGGSVINPRFHQVGQDQLQVRPDYGRAQSLPLPTGGRPARPKPHDYEDMIPQRSNGDESNLDFQSRAPRPVGDPQRRPSPMYPHDPQQYEKQRWPLPQTPQAGQSPHPGEPDHGTAPPDPIPRGRVPSQGSVFSRQTVASEGQRPLAYAHPPGHDPKPQLHVQLSIGSTVQLSDPPRYAVIRWIGELPRVEGLVAGVELEEDIEGGCDGTWRQTGVRYFDCDGRKGMFIPLESLRPDERFTAPGSTPGSTVLENPLKDVQREVHQDVLIDPHPGQIVKYLGERRGIQGHQNSCYLDATVFGLFALSDAFDEVFLKQPEDVSGKEICDMFWKGIVNPLRLNGVVRYESVMAMRNKLEELGKMKGVNHAEKDPEEFLNMLFKYTLDVEPFISIKRPFGVEKEFFVQLFVELDEQQRLPTVGSLLIKMFKEQSIFFTQVPSRLLIQVPRYGTKFKTYQKLLPALELDVSDVVDSGSLTPTTKDVVPCCVCMKPGEFKCSSCPGQFTSIDRFSYFCGSCTELVHSQRTGHAVIPVKSTGPRVSESESIPLELLSVICIETSHYVCFARSEDQWVFFDSMANRIHDAYNIPKGVNCTKELNEWVYCSDHRRLLNTPPRELPEYVRRFVQDVYMCVYIQPDVGMYG